jgi:hypothetical protein
MYLICIPKKVTLPKSLAVENHIFGRNDVLKHLRVLVTTDNVVTKEIQARLTADNRRYHALQAVLKSQIVSRKVKLNIYIHKTIIMPIVTYACETWVLTRKDELTVLVWERRVLRRIFEPICERGCYRIRTNEEVYRTDQELDLVTIIKTEAEMARPCNHNRRLQRDKESTTLYSWGGRRRGKPRKRWLDDVEDDLRKIGVKR